MASKNPQKTSGRPKNNPMADFARSRLVQEYRAGFRNGVFVGSLGAVLVFMVGVYIRSTF